MKAITATDIPRSLPSVLALDLAQHYGWAAYCDGDIISGHKKTKLKYRELLFYRDVVELIYTCKPKVIVFEDVRFAKNVAAGMCAGMWRGLLLCVCQKCGKETRGIGVKVIKKHITGNGNASKEDMIYHINLRGFDVADDNEADALGVLLTALETGVVEKT